MLAPPLASLPNEKSVLSHASRNTPTVYPKDSGKSSLYLSGYRLSHGWACSIYLFRQHSISFWRSHFTPVTAILGAARRNESHLTINAVTRMPIKKSIRGSSKKRPEGLYPDRRRRR